MIEQIEEKCFNEKENSYLRDYQLNNILETLALFCI